MTILQFLNKHKVTIILAVALLYMVGQSAFTKNQFEIGASRSNFGMAATADVAMPSLKSTAPSYPTREAAPTTAVARLVIQDTSLSLVVKSVSQTLQTIESLALQHGGYMVDSSQSSPQGPASGHISLRVPTSNRSAVLEAIKQTGSKVVSESVYGHDVTDEYTDLDTRLTQLQATKTKFEAILEEARLVPQILEVTRELQNIQTQIDSLKGQQEYLKKTAELTKITVSLSTDEIALPYAPDKPWSTEAVFRQAVRSLISTIREVGTLLIWVAVFAPLWLPIMGGIYLVNRRQKAR